MEFNCELLELSLCNINKHNTCGLRLQSRRIINYIKWKLFSHNCLHGSIKRLDGDLKHERYSNITAHLSLGVRLHGSAF